MIRLSLAIPASILIVAVAFPSSSQTNPEPAETAAFPSSMQSGAQMSTANAPGPRTLSEDELASLCMVRKQYYEAATIYKRLSDQNPKNALYLNRLAIALPKKPAPPKPQKNTK